MILGVGCEYRITHGEVDNDHYNVTVSSGPVAKLVGTNLTWLAAMKYVADQVESELRQERDYR